jgi:hypothetical protein
VNFRALPGWKATSITSVPDSTHHEIPTRRLPVPVSRHQFARTAAGSSIFSVHLVVQSIEAKLGRSLRFVVQRRLQLLNT